MSSDEAAEEEDKNSKISGKHTRSCVAWNLEEDKCLLATLQEHKVAHQADSGWKSSVWTICERNLKVKGFKNKSAKKCQNHFGTVSTDVSSTDSLYFDCPLLSSLR